LTGRRLFRRETELATMRAIVDDPIPHPSEVAPSIPIELDTIVMRALRKRKDARYATANEMAVALEKFAFSNAGFSPMQAASYAKSLFASEYLQWRKTATAALDLEVEKPAMDSSLNAEPPTAGPTMALRPGVAWSDGRSDVHSRSSQGQGPGGAARSGQFPVNRPPTIESKAAASAAGSGMVMPKRDRTWLYAVVGLLLAGVGAGAWMLTRHQQITALGAPPASASAPGRSAPRVAGVATPPEITKTQAPAAASVTQAAAENAGPPAAGPPASAGTQVQAPEPVSWKAPSRGGKIKPTTAHRRRPAAAVEKTNDEGAKAAPAADSQKDDPFAD
jgi:serine/threonine-protein kinase